jgi:hypothetical protein
MSASDLLRHPDGMKFTLGDDEGRFVSQNDDSNLFRALLIRTGGDSTGPF